MKLKGSLYDTTLKMGESRLNTGFDYSEKGIILRSTMSPYMFKNSNLADFLDDINEVCVANINNIKRIRIHNNFTVDKDAIYIN